MQLSKAFALNSRRQFATPLELLAARRYFAAGSNEYDLAVIGGGPGGKSLSPPR